MCRLGRQKSKQLDAAVHAQRRGGTGLLAAVIDDASFARLVKELQLMTVDIAVAATARSTFQHVKKVQIRTTASAAVVAVATVDATILRALSLTVSQFRSTTIAIAGKRRTTALSVVALADESQRTDEHFTAEALLSSSGDNSVLGGQSGEPDIARQRV
ncbi:hypothetical protein TYRP_009629 [Tyrophagus putrescentiae]|nr:hypothetical protein TYRP_009629 [Tyrophagus putrescentiae]